MNKCHVLEIGRDSMRPAWTYGMEGVRILKQKEGAVTQNSLPLKKYINTTFGDVIKTLSNVRLTFHFLDKYIT